MKKIGITLSLFVAILLATSCNKKGDFNYNYYPVEDKAILSQYLNLPDLPDDYSITFPKHLRSSGLFPQTIERDKAILGRVLFYDKKLSKDGTIACASCHRQDLGFSDNVPVSKGVQDRAGVRNSIALSSVANFSAYYGTDLNGSTAIRFFWDNRAATAKEQSHGSLTNPLEMDMTMAEVVAAVQAQPYYEPLFKKAYDDNNVTEDRVLESIANFVNSMGSYQSKFDDEASSFSSIYDYSITFPNFTQTESRGKDIYMANCASCHSQNMGRPVLYNACNGLDPQTTDPGVGTTSNKSSDLGTFKVPTLRNIAVTAPYMHDGRFKTLDEVVNFYNTGINAHPNLHGNLKNPDGSPKRMNLSSDDKAALIAFLNTLTDYTVEQDTRFSNPFKQ